MADTQKGPETRDVQPELDEAVQARDKEKELVNLNRDFLKQEVVPPVEPDPTQTGETEDPKSTEPSPEGTKKLKSPEEVKTARDNALGILEKLKTDLKGKIKEGDKNKALMEAVLENVFKTLQTKIQADPPVLPTFEDVRFYLIQEVKNYKSKNKGLFDFEGLAVSLGAGGGEIAERVDAFLASAPEVRSDYEKASDALSTAYTDYKETVGSKEYNALRSGKTEAPQTVEGEIAWREKKAELFDTIDMGDDPDLREKYVAYVEKEYGTKNYAEWKKTQELGWMDTLGGDNFMGKAIRLLLKFLTGKVSLDNLWEEVESLWKKPKNEYVEKAKSDLEALKKKTEERKTEWASEPELFATFKTAVLGDKKKGVKGYHELFDFVNLETTEDQLKKEFSVADVKKINNNPVLKAFLDKNAQSTTPQEISRDAWNLILKREILLKQENEKFFVEQPDDTKKEVVWEEKSIVEAFPEMTKLEELLYGKDEEAGHLAEGAKPEEILELWEKNDPKKGKVKPGFESFLNLDTKYWNGFELTQEHLKAIAENIGGGNWSWGGKGFDDDKDAFNDGDKEDKYWTVDGGAVKEVKGEENKETTARFEVNGTGWWNDEQFDSVEAFVLWLGQK